MKTFAPFLLLAILSVSTCVGRDIYVNGRGGSDLNRGTADENRGGSDGPVRTIFRALALAEPGDRIVLAAEGGPYRESVTLFGKEHSGQPGFPLIIEGNGAVLDGREPLSPGVWQHIEGDLFRFPLLDAPIDWTCFRLYEKDEMLTKVDVPAGSARLPELEENSWCVLEGAVYFCAEPGKSPIFREDYELSYSQRKVGVSLIQVRGVRIHDLTVLGFQRDGIAAANGALDVVLDNVQARQNGRSGLMIGGASRIYAGYCRFEENGGPQVLSLPYSRGLLYDCGVTEDDIQHDPEHSVLKLESGTGE